MFFHRQFETFDPVLGETPDYPFPSMPAIALRARTLLNCSTDPEWSDRARKRIYSIAARINSELVGYFDDIKYLEMERLREQAGLLQSMGGDPEWPPNEDELDIQTWENTSEVDALKSVLEKRDTYVFFQKPPSEPERYPEGEDYELFAVLTLWMLADAFGFIDKGKHGNSIAGEYALKAMDAVCYAEHLREAEWLVSYAKKENDKKLAEALEKQKSEQLGQRTEQMKMLNLARHQKTNETKARVIEEWSKYKNGFPSAEKAGLHYADWLASQGILNPSTKQPYEPRTVTAWIRAHAKKIGTRFR